MLTTDQDVLKSKLTLIANITKQRTSTAVLKNIILTWEGDALSIEATDLEITAKFILNGITTSSESCVVECKALLNAIKNMNKGNVDLELFDGLLVVSQGDFKINVQTHKYDEQPLITYASTADDKLVFMGPSKDLASRLESCIYASSNDETRFHLMSVFIDYVESCFVATNGHRLAKVMSPVIVQHQKTKTKDMPVIPANALRIVIKALKKSCGDTYVYRNGTNLVMKTPSMTFQIRLIDGGYPNYKQLIPKNFDAQIKVNVKDMLAALKRIEPLTHKESKGMKLEIENGRMQGSAWCFEKLTPLATCTVDT